jgi:hypothetical protein
MLDVELFGLQPVAHHLMSVAIHLANALLVFELFRFTTGALWRSAFVAAVFAVHPLHVESVAWVAERKDVLSALFSLLTLRACPDVIAVGKSLDVETMKHEQPSGRPRRRNPRDPHPEPARS